MAFSYRLTIAVMLLTSQAAFAGDLFPKVLVTVAPLKPYVDEILAGRGESANLLRPGQEPHEFSLAPSQAAMLDGADIVIVPDLSMNPFLKGLLAKKKRITVIELSALKGADMLPYPATNPWLEKMKQSVKPEKIKKTKGTDTHNHGDKLQTVNAPLTDPHVWLDPERMAAIAVPLANAIAERAPEARSELTANARGVAKHLREQVMPALRTLLSKQASLVDSVSKPQIPFITYHAAYQYFLERFALDHYGELTTRPDQLMGAKTASTLISGADSLRVRCLIGEQSSVLMDRIATATGARIILLSPEQLVERKTIDPLDWMKNDYDRFLYVTAKAFSGCL